MKVLDKNINAWQLGIMLFILLFANKILVLPSLLFEGAGLEAVFIPVLFFVLEMGLLFLFYKLKTKHPAQSFSFLLKNRFGTPVQVVAFVFLCAYFLCKAVLLYNVTYIFFRNVVYKDYSSFLFLFCFIPIMNHLAISGLRVMGRTMQLFFPFMLTIVLFCLVVGVFGINSSVLMFSKPFAEIALTAAKHISSFGDVVLVFVVMHRVQIKKGEWKVVFSLVTLASVLVCLITVIFILSYTYTAFMHPYAIFEIMSYVKEYGGLGRIDVVSMVGIIVFAYFHLAIYLKAFMLCFKEVFPKINPLYSVLTFNLAFLLIVGFFILNLEQAVSFAEKILPYFAIIPFGIVPILSGLLFLIKKRKEVKNE